MRKLLIGTKCGGTSNAAVFAVCEHGDLVAAHIPPLSRRERTVERYTREVYAVERRYLASDRVKHALDLMEFTLGYSDDAVRDARGFCKYDIAFAVALADIDAAFKF